MPGAKMQYLAGGLGWNSGHSPARVEIRERKVDRGVGGMGGQVMK